MVKDNGDHTYYRYLSQLGDSDDEDEMEAESSPFGQVKFIALNAKKTLLSMYCDAETRGRLIVTKADMSAVLDDKDT